MLVGLWLITGGAAAGLFGSLLGLGGGGGGGGSRPPADDADLDDLPF